MPSSPLARGRLIAVAVALTVAPVVAALVLAPSDPNPRATYTNVVFPPQWENAPPDYSGLVGRYRRLNNWDSLHYLSIAEFGYRQSASGATRSSIFSYQDNQAFLPGYPITVRFASRLLHMPPDLSLLVVAQALALLAWTYLLLLLRFAGVAGPRSVAVAAAVGASPAAFFLVAGYSESTFVAAMLGFAYWHLRYRRERKTTWLVVSALHGVLLSATRVMGAPLAFFPVVLAAVEAWRGNRPQWQAAIATATVSLAGIVGYLVYLQVASGDWKTFFTVQATGWSSEANYLAPFLPSSYVPRTASGSVHFLSELALPVGLVAIVWCTIRVARAPISWGLLFMAAAQFYLIGAARVSRDMASALRFFLPVTFLLGAVWAIDAKPAPRCKRWIAWVVGVLSAATEIALLNRYLHGLWVA